MQLPQRYVLDGEIVIVRSGGLDFEARQLHLRTAESRVRLPAQEMPASVVFFDNLCEGDRDLRSVSFEERRSALARLLARAAAGAPDAVDPRQSRRGGLVPAF